MAYTYVAGADFTGKQGFAVKADSDNREVALATANSVNVGILVDTNTEGKAVVVAEEGERVLAKLGGAVTFGDKLKSDSAGKLVVAGGTGDDNVIAEAKEDGSTNDLIYVVVGKFVK